MDILDQRVKNGSKKNFYHKGRKSLASTNNAQFFRPGSSQVNQSRFAGDRTPEKARTKMRATMQSAIALYSQDSEVVPHYYSRPGPGNYNMQAEMGKLSTISQYQNSPAWAFPKPKTFESFITIQNFKSDAVARKHDTQTSRSRSPHHSALMQSEGRVSATDFARHRFMDFAFDMRTKTKQLKMLNPNRN